MTQLRRDAAYILTTAHERTSSAGAVQLSQFDEQVCQLLSTAHTVTSAARSLNSSSGEPSGPPLHELENRVAESMQRLLQAERIQLSPDS